MQEQEAVHERLRDLARRSSNLELPMGALQAITELKERLRDLEIAAVRQARARGATWVDICQVLGVTRQALHQRMAQRTPN